MITTDFVKECLEIIDLKYSELPDGAIAVSFKDDDFFSYEVVTFIRVADERLLTFTTRALDYHPEGDLLAMANRHNCRCHAPNCFIDEDNDVIMDRAFVLEFEVSPHYILENIIKPSIFLPLECFANFELTDSELEEKNSNQ